MATLPVTNGLVGWYKGEAWNGTSWPDLSGNGNHCTVTKGTINKMGRYIYGRTTAGLQFPSAILPSTYTLFHVAKYNGPSRGRIFDGVNNINWLSGFHGNRTGITYHGDSYGGWLTQSATTAFPVSNVLISTDQKALYRGNGINLTTRTVTGSADRLSINYGNYTGIIYNESSDWAVSEVIVYNRELSLEEITNVETYLNTRVGEVDLNIIQDTFGGTNPVSLNEYYGKSGYIPSSGTIGYNNLSTIAQVPLPGIPRGNLQVVLDASDFRSYPGSGTTWYDISGNGRHGTWASGPTFQGTYFDTTSVCTGPASNSFGITNTSGYTIFIKWYQNTLTDASAFKFNGSGTYNRGIFSHCTWSNQNIYFDQGGCCNADTRLNVACPNSTGTWHTTAFVRETGSSTRRIYIDGSLAATNTAAAANMNLNSSVVYYVGDDQSGAGWNAAIRCFLAYNRGLSATEIAQLHANYI
jgi:hypothetical protein